MSTNYAIEPKEWLAGIVNHTLNQFTMTPENTTVVAVDEILGSPHKAEVTLHIDRNVGMVEGIGLVPYTEQYLERKVTIVRRVGADIMKEYGANGSIHVKTSTVPTTVAEVIALVKAQHGINIAPVDVHEQTISGFGPVDITFRAKSFAFFGRIRVNVVNG